MSLISFSHYNNLSEGELVFTTGGHKHNPLSCYLFNRCYDVTGGVMSPFIKDLYKFPVVRVHRRYSRLYIHFNIVGEKLFAKGLFG